MHIQYLGRPNPNFMWCCTQSWSLCKPSSCYSTIIQARCLQVMEYMVRTMHLMFMTPLLYCLCYRVGYFFRGNIISHATSMDQEFSRQLDGVEGQRRQFYIHNMYLFQKRQNSALCSVEEDLSNPLSTSWLACLPPKNFGLLGNSSDIARSLC